ncbi:Eukaryotic translation initiation factor 3 subunit M [Symbiodinium microadriaticum]|uniref:Eukaryotic translation initiation factor 3 subunit M n=1 Tax=Symbiodinium microadriaticum TaxID=2951 RepID=A0A1Q9CH80_SYMMI|nr:Eukaryotic translation initiation factor 3 subunit M [Symbiodinium microadriaticum]
MDGLLAGWLDGWMNRCTDASTFSIHLRLWADGKITLEQLSRPGFGCTLRRTGLKRPCPRSAEASAANFKRNATLGDAAAPAVLWHGAFVKPWMPASAFQGYATGWDMQAPAMATYINYGEGEDDAIVQGAEWLMRLLQLQQGMDAEKAFTDKFRKEFQAVQDAPRYDIAPVFDLFVDYSKNLFTAIPENKPEERLKEIESFFALILSMLSYFEDSEHLDKSTTRLCELLSADTEQQPELRLRLLMMLYNTFSPPLQQRYRIFKYALDYAAAADMFDQVLPYLDYLDSWMADWESYLKIDEKRALYADISRHMRGYGKKSEAFQYLKQYHGLFQGAASDAMTKPEVVEQTIQLIKDAVMLPAVIQFDDVLMLDTVKALKSTPQGNLVTLCEIFLSGSVDDLKDFHKKNEKLFDEHSLNFQEAMSKIRLLTLATMARGQSELPLDDIAKRIQESPTAVEPWVVRAISEGVIDGRIDQLNRKVLVKSAFLRKFEKEEWNFLDSKLSHWIENLEQVIKFLGEQKNKNEALMA